MKFTIVVVIFFIIIIFFLNYLINIGKKETYLKAGKKWDGIVEELRKRK